MNTATPVKPSQPGLGLQIVVRGLAAPIAMAALLMLSAGSLDYWQGWLYIGLNVVLMLANLWVLRKSPELIKERLQPGEGIKPWDKAYFALSTALFFATLIIAGLDARFGWTGTLSPWVYVVAVAVYIAGQGVFLWAKATNRYFSSVVRIQTDRGQTVCRQGPYQYVRHPGYVGGLLYTAVSSLVLGSLWALLPQLLACLLLVVRTGLEDRTLQAELPGYAEYAREVRYRLMPGVW